jgi:hypothetical protein
MVSVEVPVEVPAAVVTVSVALPDPLMLVGLNPAEAPAGSPLAPSATDPLKPFSDPTVIV